MCAIDNKTTWMRSGYRYNTWAHVLDSGELLIHHHNIFRKTGTASTHSKLNMVAYQGGVHTVCEGIVILLLCFTNIKTSIHLNNVRQQTGRVWRCTMDVCMTVSGTIQSIQVYISRNYDHVTERLFEGEF